jgi:hypothetical protein
MTTYLGVFQLRGATAAQWTASNPILAAREMGVETDTSKTKVGDGATHWSSLQYSSVPQNAASTLFLVANYV